MTRVARLRGPALLVRGMDPCFSLLLLSLPSSYRYVTGFWEMRSVRVWYGPPEYRNVAAKAL